jgi:Tfp pilus assembly protein PilF
LDARLEKEPNRAELLVLSAQVYGAERSLGKAETALRKAIQVDSTSPAAYSMLAGVLLAAGKLDAARAEFDQIAQRDPRNVAAQTMAAVIVEGQGRVAEAKRRYETIVAANPTAAIAANNLAWIYAEEGDKLEDALRLARAAATQLPDNPDVNDTIGWIYLKRDLPGLAVPAFEKSLEEAPENADTHYHLALAHSKAGDVTRAREAAERALKIKPGHADARKLLASL